MDRLVSVLFSSILISVSRADSGCSIFPQYPHDEPEYFNISSLGVAAYKNSSEVVHQLIASGCDPNYNDTVMQYQGGGIVGQGAGRLLIKLIKKVANRNMDPVEVPVPPSKNTTITLPTITKNKPEETTTSQNDIPKFRVSMISTQRSMVISSLGISDLVGG